MTTSEPSTQKLTENLVKKALEPFAWDKLKQHLLTVEMDEHCVHQLRLSEQAERKSKDNQRVGVGWLGS